MGLKVKLSVLNFSQAISDIAEFTGEDLTDLGDSTIGDFMDENDIGEDEAGLYLLGN